MRRRFRHSKPPVFAIAIRAPNGTVVWINPFTGRKWHLHPTKGWRTHAPKG